MKRIGVVANLEKENSLARAGEIVRRLEELGAGVACEENLATALPGKPSIFTLDAADLELAALVVLGGDGTLIRTFRRLRRKEIPLLGLKMGGLGFLTEFPVEELDRALEDLLRDRLRVERRMTLDGALRRGGEEAERFTALNELAIGKGGLARVLKLEAFLDREYLTAYMADGLILATPTGSTAYSLSAQGPIVSPEADVILINPICPHTLTNRPIIVGADRAIRIRLETAPAETSLTVDGQVGFPLRPDDELVGRRGEASLSLFTDPAADYYSILRRKLHWGGRSHYHR